MVTSARLVLISLLAGLLGGTKLVLCLRSQVVGRSRGSRALSDGRTSEQPTGDFDDPAGTFRTATGEGEEQRQPRRRRRRHLQSGETTSPVIPVPTLSYDDDDTVGMTAGDSSTSSGNQPTVAPVKQVTPGPAAPAKLPTTAPTPAITSIASPAASPSSTVGATATAVPLGKVSTSLGPEEPPTLAPSVTPSSRHPITDKPLSPMPQPTPTPTPTDTKYVTAPSENPVPTPAPVVVSGVSTLKGLISVPTETLGKSTLFDLFGDYLALEDQDRVTIDAPSSRRRLREFEKLGGDGNNGGLLDLGKQGFVPFAIEAGKYKEREGLPPYARDVGYYDGRRHHRALAEDTMTTREFAVAFINDPGESAAFGRSLAAAVLLLSSNGTEVFAERLNTTEHSIVFSDVVFAAPASEDIATAAAVSTFYGGNDSPSGTAIGLAAVLMAVAVVATGCFGVALGKCWLVGERGRRAHERATMKQPPSQPAYETHQQPLSAPPLSLSSKRLGRSGFGGTVSGGGGSSSGASTLKNASRTFGGAVPRDASMRAPSSSTVPRGGDGATATAAAAASEGRDPLLEHDPENSLIGSGRGFVRAERSAVSGGVEDLVEHVYGDAGQTESFADLIDGAFSEYEGQSEYDPVVPGGTSMTDGIMSDTGSSRFYFDDEHPSEWGTEEVGSQQDNGSLGGFPLRRGSSRFSAGPRSQASFAAPSVAASGRSALSSVVPPSSRTNFPPPSGGGASPSVRQSDERGFLAGGVLAGGTRRIESRAAVAPVDTETEAIRTAQAGGNGGKFEEDEKGDGSSGEGETLDGYESPRDDERKALLQGHAGEEEGGGGEPSAERQAGEGAAAASAAGMNISGASAAAAGGKTKGLEEKRGAGKAQVGPVTVPALPSVFAAEAPPTPIPPAAPEGAVTAAGTRVANGAVGAEDTADADAGHETPGGDAGDVARRPSLDSAAGSITLSSVVSIPRRGAGSGGVGKRIGLGVPQSRGIRITSGGDGVIGGGGDGGAYEDDDAESRYAGSSVANESVRHEGRISGASSQPARVMDDDAESRYAGSSVANESVRHEGRISGASSRPTRVMGSLSGGPTGRNSQSVGGMTISGVESSHGSDRDSFVSRVESSAYTDVGPGAQEGVAFQGRGGHGISGVSPTSTLMRSTCRHAATAAVAAATQSSMPVSNLHEGMSELGTERDSYGSDGYTNGSDSPGAQSGWERAWMRQRDDARHFGGR